MMEKQPKKQPAMNERMIKFCEYYVDTRNGVRSYSLAYNKPIDKPEDKAKNYATCSSNATKLMKDPRIKKYIEDKLLELDYERELSEQEIVMHLNKMALGAQYKENTRLKALEMLSKMKGMYSDGEEDNGTTVTINLSSDLKDLMKDSDDPEEE